MSLKVSIFLYKIEKPCILDQAFSSKGPAVLIGFLSGSYFVHSGIINLVQDNRKKDPWTKFVVKKKYENFPFLNFPLIWFGIKENTTRDIIISYVFVVLSYFIFGYLYYFLYPGPKKCMQDLFTEDFHPCDPIIPFTYIILIFRMLTVTII